MDSFLKSLGIEYFDWNLILKPIIYIILGFFVYKLLSNGLRLFLRLSPDKVGQTNYQRLQTVNTLGSNILKYVISLIVILIILAVYGVDVSSIFAGLGIATAILGLALQDLAKDIIAGISILSENQFQVGDLIEVDGFRGRVIFLGLKTTKIRNFRGKIKVIANHNLSTLVNYSQDNTLAIVDVEVAYKHDSKDIEKALDVVKKKLDGTIEDARGEIKVLGITGLTENGVKWRIQCPCAPYKHFKMQRMLRRTILDEFATRKIEIPFKQVKIHNEK